MINIDQSLLRAAVYLLYLFILRLSECVCLCVLVWVVVVVVVCLVSLLIYYGRIWVALSYCFLSLLPVLFCFESCCMCVSVMVVCEGSSLLVCVFFQVQLKPTLNKRKKVRNEPRCFPFVWLWVCRMDICVSEWVWVNFLDSKRCQRVVK